MCLWEEPADPVQPALPGECPVTVTERARGPEDQVLGHRAQRPLPQGHQQVAQSHAHSQCPGRVSSGGRECMHLHSPLIFPITFHTFAKQSNRKPGNSLPRIPLYPQVLPARQRFLDKTCLVGLDRGLAVKETSPHRRPSSDRSEQCSRLCPQAWMGCSGPRPEVGAHPNVSVSGDGSAQM